MILTCAFSALLIAEISSVLIIQFQSKQFETNKEDTPELGKKTPYNRNHRQARFGIFQPINSTYFPRIFKKTAISIPPPIQL
jgi:hypothetical protein